MTAALQANGLGRRYGTKWGLRDCNLSVPEGSVTGLVGPNGAGKTTLLRMAAGLSRATEGTIRSTAPTSCGRRPAGPATTSAGTRSPAS